MVAAVPYNVIHTVSIVATNCNGSSSAAMVTIPTIGELSGYPTFPYQGCSKLFRGGGPKVMCVSMDHVQGSGGMAPRKLCALRLFLKPFLAKNIISSIILGKRDFRSYYTFHSADCRLCIT